MSEAFYTFKAAGTFAREDYLARVAATAAAALAYMVKEEGEPEGTADTNWYSVFFDIVSEICLYDEAAFREVYACSPNLFKAGEYERNQAIESASLYDTDKEATEALVGQFAYQVFALDLWEAVHKLGKERYGASTWANMCA
jgi:hypothetical protein